MPRPGLGRHWSLSTAVTPAHTRSIMGRDLLKCKQEERIWALWVAVELVITYSVCECARTHRPPHTPIFKRMTVAQGNHIGTFMGSVTMRVKVVDILDS